MHDIVQIVTRRSAFAWPILRAELDGGDIVRWLGYLLAAVLAAGLIAGAMGLEVGSALGAAWEHQHRLRRARRASFAAACEVSHPAATDRRNRIE